MPDEEISYHEESLFAAPQFNENIYEYMRSRETKGRPKPDFLRKQNDITKDMRQTLIDWLSDVVGEYNMSQVGVFCMLQYLIRKLFILLSQLLIDHCPVFMCSESVSSSLELLQ